MKINAGGKLPHSSHTPTRKCLFSFVIVPIGICNILWLFHVMHPKIDPYQEQAVQRKNFNFTSSLCPEIRSLHNIDDIDEEMTCQPRPPSKESCEYTAKHFKIIPSSLTCHDQNEPSYNLCNLSNDEDQSNEVEVTCDISVCDIDKYLIIEELDLSNGLLKNLRVEKRERNSKTFAKLVKAALIRARENDVNFIFLNCTRKEKNMTISQLISVVPKLQYLKFGELKPHGGKLNLNVLLLDSISRAHFYRSFPKTIEYLRAKRDNRKPKSPFLFEFQLFQGIHSNTHETEKGFFTGELYPENYTYSQKAKSPTSPNVLFGTLKKAGYQTMFLEDLCYLSGFGLVSSFMTRKWNTLNEKLKTSNIDTVGEYG